ncbi:antitoxin MazE family protein [Sphingomonas bacterium]|uniref:antitoxin MazE family protein n=1 Tax=Sphingomonas bacterium TaxID=1895847 RepID=UPI0015757679|nr:antitoxin MazE family protein [Sphingomonas bacterium]
MNAPPEQSKFQAYRARKKAAGLREVRMWVPDTRTPEFQAEARRQAALLNHSDDEKEAIALMEALASEVWEDGDWR